MLPQFLRSFAAMSSQFRRMRNSVMHWPTLHFELMASTIQNRYVDHSVAIFAQVIAWLPRPHCSVIMGKAVRTIHKKPAMVILKKPAMCPTQILKKPAMCEAKAELPTKIMVRTWEKTYDGPYYKWELESITVKPGSVEEVWKGIPKKVD